MKKRLPFKKNVPSVASERAFDGTGRVRKIITSADHVSKYLREVSHAIIRPDAVAGWYEYEEDLLVIVISGKAKLLWRDGGDLSIESGDIAFVPAKEQYRLDNPTSSEFEALFIRVSFAESVEK